MKHPQLHHDHLKHLNRRGQLPSLDSNPDHHKNKPSYPIPNEEDIQGDVFILFPKEHENFVFFEITDVGQFKKDLATYNPTSTHDVLGVLHQIAQSKAANSGNRVEHYQSQVAFSRSGLNKLGVKDKIHDRHFDQGSMKNEFKKVLSDSGPWYEPFKSKPIDGVFSVAASHDKTCKSGTNAIISKFKNSIEYTEIRGNARPAKNRGHEHFGYKDGVSQPALRGLCHPHKGQPQCDPGVVIIGYHGDPYIKHRPKWAKAGSLMVFRQLEQDVPEFQDYLERAGPKWKQFLRPDQVKQLSDDPLNAKEGAELFGARIVGRWKSGAPLAKCPFRDNPKVAADREQANDFDYSVPGTTGPSDKVCPFTAHTRKTAPRNLDPYLNKRFLESALIVRAGLPYGPEVTDAEKQAKKTQKKRGLLFVCYQSSTEHGFWQQTDFGGNDYFPTTSLVPVKHGQDPIIGSPEPSAPTVNVKGPLKPGPISLNVNDGSKPYTVDGIVRPASATATAVDPEFFVSSRGGEYFFVPSIPTLREWSGRKAHTTGGDKPKKPHVLTHPPTEAGKYRIKTIGQQGNCYWKLTHRKGEDPWVSLAPLNKSDTTQQWHITPVSGGYHITNVSDNSGLVEANYGYWGHHFPIRSEKTSAVWLLKGHTTQGVSYTQISMKNHSGKVCDCRNEDKTVVHFYPAHNNAHNQRWVFESV